TAPSAPTSATGSPCGDSSSSTSTCATTAGPSWRGSPARPWSRSGGTTGFARWTSPRRSSGWCPAPSSPSSSRAATRRRSRSAPPSRSGSRRSSARSPLGVRRPSSLAREAHALQRLVDASEGRNRHEAVVPRARHVDLLLEVEEHVGCILHQELRELRVVLLALGGVGGAACRLERLVRARGLVMGEVAALPLARVPDCVGEGGVLGVVGAAHPQALESP